MRDVGASKLAVALAVVAISATVAIAGFAWITAEGNRPTLAETLRWDVPDDLSGWQEAPMTPDPALSEAARSHRSCQTRSISLMATPPPPLALPMLVVLQDRRAPRTAAFIVATVGYVGACVLSPAAEGWGWLIEGPLPAMADGVVFDGGGSFGLGAASRSVEYLWGRADARVVSVQIDLGNALDGVDDDDRVVIASIGDGFWLGWWPARTDRPPRLGDNQATLVTGFDAQGNVVGTVKHTTNDGWVTQ